MTKNFGLTASIRDATQMSGLSRTALYELAAAGKIIFRKAGRRTLVDLKSLRRFLDALPVARIGSVEASHG